MHVFFNYLYINSQGTMEEKIYDRQVTKESLSKRVVDQAQIGRHYTASDLAELFTYSPKPLAEPPYRRPIVIICACSLFCHIMYCTCLIEYVRTLLVPTNTELPIPGMVFPHLI